MTNLHRVSTGSLQGLHRVSTESMRTARSVPKPVKASSDGCWAMSVSLTLWRSHAARPALSILARIHSRLAHRDGRRVTLFSPDWIEAVFRVDPDKGNGSVEWLVVSILLFLAVALAGGARLEWHRAQLAER